MPSGRRHPKPGSPSFPTALVATGQQGRRQLVGGGTAKRLLPQGAEAGKLAGLWLRLRCRSRGSGRRSTTLVIPRSPETRDTGPLCHVWGRRLVHGRLRRPLLERQSPGHRTM